MIWWTTSSIRCDRRQKAKSLTKSKWEMCAPFAANWWHNRDKKHTYVMQQSPYLCKWSMKRSETQCDAKTTGIVVHSNCTKRSNEINNVNDFNENIHSKKRHWKEKESVESIVRFRTQRCIVEEKHSNAKPIGQRANSPIKTITRYNEMWLIDLRAYVNVTSTNIVCVNFVERLSCLASFGCI